MKELHGIAKNLGIKSVGVKKADLVHEIMKYHDEESPIENEEDLMNFNIFKVRYFGPKGVIRMNAQSLESNNEYDFYRAQWLEVDEQDYWHWQPV